MNEIEEIIKQKSKTLKSYVGLGMSIDECERFVESILMASETVKENELLHDIRLSFSEDERTEFVERVIILNAQNLNGRETSEELYEKGVVDCFDDLVEKLSNEA